MRGYVAVSQDEDESTSLLLSKFDEQQKHITACQLKVKQLLDHLENSVVRSPRILGEVSLFGLVRTFGKWSKWNFLASLPGILVTSLPGVEGFPEQLMQPMYYANVFYGASWATCVLSRYFLYNHTNISMAEISQGLEADQGGFLDFVRLVNRVTEANIRLPVSNNETYMASDILQTLKEILATLDQAQAKLDKDKAIVEQKTRCWRMDKPTYVTSLQLVNSMTVDEFRYTCTIISATKITALIFRGQGFFADRSAEFWDAIKLSAVTSLDLSFNDFNQLTAVQQSEFWQRLKTTQVETLTLIGNDLNQLTAEQWAQFWLGVKTTALTSLNLSANQLFQLDDVQWMAFHRGLRSTRVALNLDQQDLKLLTAERREQVAFRSVESLQTLCLRGIERHGLGSELQRALDSQAAELNEKITIVLHR